MRSKYKNLKVSTIFILLFFSLFACADGHIKPDRGDSSEHPHKIPPTHKEPPKYDFERNLEIFKAHDKESDFVIFFKPDGDIVVKIRNQIVEGKDLPLRLNPTAKVLESVEAITIFEYSGSDKYKIINGGGISIPVPIYHTEHPH